MIGTANIESGYAIEEVKDQLKETTKTLHAVEKMRDSAAFKYLKSKMEDEYQKTFKEAMAQEDAHQMKYRAERMKGVAFCVSLIDAEIQRLGDDEAYLREIIETEERKDATIY